MSTERLHYLDNLRALAMLAGVLFHAALAYSPLAYPAFPTADRATSAWVDAGVWLLHLFRMPLFFLIAGYFCARLLMRHGLPGLIRDRLLRIALPFFVLWPVMHLALQAMTLHAARTAQYPPPLLQFLRDLLAREGTLPPMPPSTHHLWFLSYLMLFYLLVWVARTLELGALGTRLRTLPTAWLLLAAPLLLAPALASVTAPHPAPNGILPQFWALGFFGPFFALGYVMHGDAAMVERLYRPAAWLLGGGLLLYAAWWWLIDRDPEALLRPAGWQLGAVQAYLSVWMTLACLGLGRRLLDRPQRLLRPLIDSAYWTYLMHLPVLFAIQYRLMDAELPWPAKFALAVSATLALCLLSHRLLVRHTPLARVFGGAAPRPAPQA